MRTSVLQALVVAATVIGNTACSKDPATGPAYYRFMSAAGGAYVVPLPAPGPDRTCAATATITANDDSTITYSYTVTTAPDGIIDSVAIYTGPTGQALAASASVVLCATSAGCASMGGTTAKVATGYSTLRAAMRAYGTQLVFFTTTRQIGVGGAMRGVLYPAP